MAFPKDTSQRVMTKKRPLDDADDREPDEFRNPKPVVRKYPPPKIRIGVEAVRDFPPGCGIIHDSIESKAERNPLKKLDIGNMASHGTENMVDSQPFENTKLSSFKPKESGFNKPYFGSKSPRKVKYWDPTEQVVHDLPPVSGIKKERKPLKNLDNVDPKLGFNKPSFATRPPGKVKHWDPTSNDDNAPKPKATNTIVSQKEQIRREKIRDAMTLFDTVYTRLFQENGSKQQREKMAHCRVPMEASKIVKQKLKWMDPYKTLGQIRGVQPGDIFKFRSQLQMVGLHCQPHCGIDYTKINGKNIALSIVDSRRYSNTSQSCDVLTYCGEGGHGVSGWSRRNVPPDDQKLERGNLALKNSMHEKSPVRVIKKVFGVGNKNNNVFVYDGLYTVDDCTQTRGSEGKMVFKFQLHKMAGQSQLQKRVTLCHYSTFQLVS
ncbi:hypothetical protein L1887_16751 [Cichorium endivia]|nr:hypothetical protein L1887_16751 [Cichorium endivia]